MYEKIKAEQAYSIRYCSDIGMFAIDRPLSTCDHASKYCREKCYFKKFIRQYPSVRAKQRRMTASLPVLRDNPSIVGQVSRDILDRRRNQTDRVRCASGGENFATPADVEIARSTCDANPDREFWFPTKAWRDATMRRLVEKLSRDCPNAKILASTDPSTTSRQWRMLHRRGWSTMFFGDDTGSMIPDYYNRIPCPKTWGQSNVKCSGCTVGCFNVGPIVAGTEVFCVHLKEH